MDAKTGSIDGGGCPFNGGVRALLGRTNRDWWPEMLATEILNPNGPSNPMGPDSTMRRPSSSSTMRRLRRT